MYIIILRWPGCAPSRASGPPRSGGAWSTCRAARLIIIISIIITIIFTTIIILLSLLSLLLLLLIIITMMILILWMRRANDQLHHEQDWALALDDLRGNGGTWFLDYILPQTRRDFWRLSEISVRTKQASCRYSRKTVFSRLLRRSPQTTGARTPYSSTLLRYVCVYIYIYTII